MANNKSAEKRIRSSRRRTQVNKHILSALKNCQKMLDSKINEKDSKAVESGLKLLFKLSDRAEKKGIIKKNTSSRKKSRFASKVHKVLSN